MPPSSSLSGKVIAITGAASGIGLSTAYLLASHGCILSLSDISAADLQAASDSIQKASPDAKIHAQVLNVTSSSEVDAWISNVVRQFGRLDGAANLAGVLSKLGMTVEDCPDEEWDRVMGINASGMFFCVRAQLRVMGKREGEGEGKGGSIVNAASVAGLQGSSGVAPYCSSKHAVIGLTKSAAKEVGGRGIRLNCIAPGPIKTPMTVDMDVDGEPMRQRTALGRPGKPEEVAQLIAFLLSDESSYISASVHAIDGGMMA